MIGNHLLLLFMMWFTFNSQLFLLTDIAKVLVVSLFFQSFVAKSSCYDFICTSIINVVIGLFCQRSHVHLPLLQHLFATCHLHQQCFHSHYLFLWIPLHLFLGKHFMQEVLNVSLFTLVLSILLLVLSQFTYKFIFLCPIFL